MTQPTDTAAQVKAPGGTCSNVGTKSSPSSQPDSPAKSGAASAGTPQENDWAVLEYAESCGNTKLGSRFKIVLNGQEVGEMHDRASAQALVHVFDLALLKKLEL